MLEIKLDEYEILAAGNTALLRITESMRQNIEWGHGYKGSFNKKVADSMSGTLGELAVAKCLKTNFNYHVNNFKGADLYYKNRRVQVRTQEPKPDNFLVVDRCPLFRIIGYINSSDVIGNGEFLTDFGYKDRPKVYAVPFQNLFPIEMIFNE